MKLARQDIAGTLKESKAIRSWLGYETEEPFRAIKEVHRAQQKLENAIREEVASIKTEPKTATANPSWSLIEADLKKLGSSMATISNQFDTLRMDVTRTQQIIESSLKPQTPVPAQPSPIESLKDEFTSLQDKIDKLISLTQTHSQSPTHTETDLAPNLNNISERLDILHSELPGIRELKARPASPIKPSLETELAVEEVKQTLASIKQGVSELSMEKPQQGPHTYSQIAAKPKPPQRPNHTLIIASKDPTQTGPTRSYRRSGQPWTSKIPGSK